MSRWREILRLALRIDFIFAPTRIYVEIVHYVKIVLQAPRNLFPFGASLDCTWEWKSPEIPSRGFLFAFAGVLGLIPFGASLDLRWNFPAGTSELIPFGASLDILWEFAIPGDSFSRIPPCFPLLGFTLIIHLRGTTFSPVGGLLFFSFLGELQQ